jgi:large subunit ribosomal protein L21
MNMFAVIKTGGKQYKISENQILKVEKIEGDLGAQIVLNEVMLIGDSNKTIIGSPLVKGASVTAEIISQSRDQKIIVFKKKRRNGYRRKQGHRQDITHLKITSIKNG